MAQVDGSVVVLNGETEASLRTVGHISYALHAIVAVGAVLPGAQGSVLLLLVAFFLDLYKRGDAAGSWQESHFRWRIRSVVFSGIAYAVTAPLWLLLIAPGWIATKTTQWYLSTHEGLSDPDSRRQWMIDHAGVPAGRLGDPAEIASTIVYLCSQLAGYLTGHYIAVDGGHHRSAF